ncbi:MAG: DUF2203 domain-containing protein [Isosphaeraceae bacterium]
MAASKSKERATKPKTFTVEEANRTLPLVRAIAEDVARQTRVVIELRRRLSGVRREEKRGDESDPYFEETTQSDSELNAEESKLRAYLEELEALGIVPNGPLEGLCDFPSTRDGREVFLCWKLGEDEVSHWHEKNAGFAGRQSLDAPPTPVRTSRRPR